MPWDTLPARARALAQASLGSVRTCSALRGGQHATFRLEGGRSGVLKVRPPDRATWRREVEALALFASELSVPEVLAADADEEGAYLLMSLLPGEPLSRWLDEAGFPLEQAFLEGAAMAGRVHAVASRLTTSSQRWTDDILVAYGLGTAAFFERYEARISAASARLGLERTARILRVVRASLPRLDGLDHAVQLVHGDFQPKNLLFDAGGHLTGVIDWELARRAPRLNDLAMLMRFAGTDDLELRMVEAYGPGDRLPSEVPAAARCYELVKVTVGLTTPEPDGPDVPAWIAFVDGCLDFFERGDAGPVRLAATHLREIPASS